MKKVTMGQAMYLMCDEDALAVAIAEIKGAHSQPVQCKALAATLDKMLSNTSNLHSKRKLPPVTESSKRDFAHAVI